MSVASPTVPDAADHRRSTRAARTATGVLLAGMLVGVAPGAAAQTSTTTTEATVEETPLLVDGPAEADPDVASVPDVEPASANDGVADDDEVGEEDDAAEARVRLVMFALIGIAVLLSGLTVVYWWYTKPSRHRRPVSRPSRHRLERAEGPAARRRGGIGPSVADDDGTVDPWPTDSTSTR